MNTETESRDVLLSIKPEWVAKMLSGDKTVEIKKAFSKEPAIDHIFVYESRPKQRIQFYMLNPRVEFLPVNELWEKTKDISCVPQEWFFSYFKKTSIGIGIFFDKLHRLTEPVELTKLSSVTGNSKYHSPPQNFYYLDRRAVEFLLKGETK